jgi:antitoxin YefM
MHRITATEAQTDLARLIDKASLSHEPIAITGAGRNAVLISQEDWEAIQETLFLLSVPGLRESIREGMDTPLTECSAELDW